MCGICGSWGRYSNDLLYKMAEVIAHRGPDDAGVTSVEGCRIGLAHQRLSIIDLSETGHQPMWNINKDVAIVYNGEIYNYKELRSDLLKKGHTFRSQSDTEVLLNLYMQDGPDLLPKLNGIYAFAIWDARSKRLFLARDGIGVKPLYFAETEKGFLFASELKAILQEESVSRELDPVALHHYLTYLWAPAPRTPLKAVKKLEPGHALIVQDGRIQRKWRFYDLPYDQQLQGLHVEEAICDVRHRLEQAVQRQMVADVPVGAFLSGGLDSSSVVAFARNFTNNHRLQCFTIGFRDDSFVREGMADDLPYAQRVADHLDVDLHTIYVGPEMTYQLERMLYHLDEPQADPAPINALFISQLAREHGIKVLLSGAGGDDIFTGYRRHYALQMEKYWAWLPRFVRAALKGGIGRLPQSRPSFRRLNKAFLYADRDVDERLASYFNWNTPETLYSLYSRDMKELLIAEAACNPMLHTLDNLPKTTAPLNKMLYLEGKHFLSDHNLNYTDKMSMAVGVEARVPLLDPDLVALAARLPLHYKQRGREGKWILKKAMENILPHDVIYRPKTGFGAPLRGWLRNELKPMVADLLSEQSLCSRNLFDPVGVKNLIECDRTGQVDGTYTIFALMCIELWCRIFVDQPRPQMPGYFQ